MKIENVFSESDLINKFGYGPLLDGYRKLTNNTTKDNIMVCKICATHGKAHLNILDSNNIINHKAFEFVVTDTSEKLVEVIVEDTHIDISTRTKVLRYKYPKYLKELEMTINKDNEDGICPVMINSYIDAYIDARYAIAFCNKKRHSLLSDNGMSANKNTMYHELKELLYVIDGRKIDILLPLDCYLDNESCYIDNSHPFDDLMFRVSTVDDAEVFFEENQELLEVYISETSNLKSDNLAVEHLPDKEVKLSFYKLFVDFAKKQSMSGVITKVVTGFKPIAKIKSYYKDYSLYLDQIIDDEDSLYKSLISICLGDIYYDSGAGVDNSYIAYCGSLKDSKGDKNIENVQCSDKIKTITAFDKDSIISFKDSGFIMNRFSPLSKKVHFINTRNKAKGLMSYEYVILSLSLLYETLILSISERLGEELSEENIKSFKELCDKELYKFISISCATNYSLSIDTYQDGDTYININLYFPGVISPYNMCIELTQKEQ